MTIKELIEELEKYPNNAEVEFTTIWYPEFGSPEEEDLIIKGVKEYLEYINILYLH